MGIVVVAFLAANALGGPPGAKITDTRSARCGSPAATAPRLRASRSDEDFRRECSQFGRTPG